MLAHRSSLSRPASALLSRFFGRLFALVTLLALQWPSEGHALGSPSQEVLHKGILVGAVAANFTGNDAQGTVPRFGFAGGGFVKYGRPDLAVQAELLYIQHGATVPLGAASSSINSNYIELPVLLKFVNPLGDNSDRAYRTLYIGPVVAFNVGSSLRLNAYDASQSVSIKNANAALFGLVCGADATWNPTGRTEITVDLRGSFGLSPVFRNAAPGAGRLVTPDGQAPNVHNSAITLALGFGF